MHHPTVRIAYTTAFVTPVVEHWLERETATSRSPHRGRAFAYGAVGRRIDPSWGGPIELFLVPASAPRLV